MTDKILKYLKEIEAKKNIKILLACETGSRAWGFPSPNSDYDIRLIYVHKKDWYLSLSNKKDSIELMFENNDIDISGWELKKSLQLLKKSNAPLLERIQSSIIYSADKEFISDILNVSSSYYSKIATMHHYLSMAKKIKSEIEEKKEYKLKKLFYALRTATVCKWIIEKEKMPPIDFTKIYLNLSLDKKIIQNIESLIELKKTKNESYLHQGESLIFSFIEDCIMQADEIKLSLPAAKGNAVLLDEFFRKYINKYDD